MSRQQDGFKLHRVPPCDPGRLACMGPDAVNPVAVPGDPWNEGSQPGQSEGFLLEFNGAGKRDRHRVCPLEVNETQVIKIPQTC